MKTYIFLLLPIFSFSQNVGIGTANPKESLEVIGSVGIATETYTADNTYSNNTAGFSVVSRDPQSSIINGQLYKQETLYAPIVIQPYSVENIYQDDLNDLNLQIPTDKYFVAITNFQAIPSTSNAAEPNNGLFATNNNKGHFEIKVTSEGGMWHAKIGYPTLNTRYTSNRYTYKFDIVLFSKRFYKDLGEIKFNLGGSNTGQASSTPPGI